MFENEKITAIRRNFEDFFQSGKLSGTWLLAGEKGLGKASLAIDIAKYVFAKGRYDDTAINAMVDNKAYPDLLYIQRDFTETEKKDIIKTLKAGEVSVSDDRKRNSEITVDDIRKIDGFMHLKPISGWKVIIIDAADDMNTNAANAALKAIEEPVANCVVFLISHSPAKLLPTILSRCRKVNFPLFDCYEIKQVIQEKYNNINTQDAFCMAKMGYGSIGKSLSLYEVGAVDILKELFDVFKDFPKLNRLKVYDFAAKYEKDEQAFDFIAEIYLLWLAKLARLKACSSIDENDIWLEEEQAIDTVIATTVKTEKLLDLYTKLQTGFAKTKWLYLDKKQVLLNSILELELC